MAAIFAGQITGSWDADAKATSQALSWGLEECSSRVVVAKFKKGSTKTTRASRKDHMKPLPARINLAT